MNRSIILPLAVLLILVVIFVAVWMSGERAEVAAITNFEECAAAGYPVMESFPEQCRTPDGRTFVREIEDPAESMIRITSPTANQDVSSPLVVSGEARGIWYFEATFPIDVLDENGTIIGQGYAEAQGEWMTEEFVPFTGSVAFTSTPSTNGTVVFHKANASGLPEHDAEVRVPVRFSGTASSGVEGCFVGGCSGQLCTDDPGAVSTCEFRPEYACYKESFARCERQPNGQCGWTQNAQLQACLANPPAVE